PGHWRTRARAASATPMRRLGGRPRSRRGAGPPRRSGSGRSRRPGSPGGPRRAGTPRSSARRRAGGTSPPPRLSGRPGGGTPEAAIQQRSERGGAWALPSGSGGGGDRQAVHLPKGLLPLVERLLDRVVAEAETGLERQMVLFALQPVRAALQGGQLVQSGLEPLVGFVKARLV